MMKNIRSYNNKTFENIYKEYEKIQEDYERE